MDDSRHEKEERGITKNNSGISRIRMEKWYRGLMDDCQTIITEAVFQSRWALVEGYHNLGKRILEDHDNFERAKIYGEKIVQGLAGSLNMSSRIIWYAMQFVQKYPDLNEVPGGKSITWNRIITKYLTTSNKSESFVSEYWIKCPNCGHKFPMDKYNKGGG